MILVSATFEILPFEILSYFHQNVILLISGNIFPSTEVKYLFGGEKKLIYCLKLSMTGIESLTFIKECSFTERLFKI